MNQLLYHFIEPRFLVGLLRRNSFRTSPPETYLTKGQMGYIDGKRQRFISLTRNRNHKEGYPVIMLDGSSNTFFDSIICRITLDGFSLRTHCNFKSYKGKQHHFKIRPIDWSYYDNNNGDVQSYIDNYGVRAHNGKEWMMKSDGWSENKHWIEDGCSSEDKYGIMSDMYSHPYSQAEERLVTDVKYIPNANKYIDSIDIYTRENENKFCNENDVISDEDFEFIKKIRKYCQSLNIPVYFYNNEQAFAKQCINKTLPFSSILCTHSRYLHDLY